MYIPTADSSPDQEGSNAAFVDPPPYQRETVIVTEEKGEILLEEGQIATAAPANSNREEHITKKKKKGKKSHKKKKKSKSKDGQSWAMDAMNEDDSNIMYDASNTSALAASDYMHGNSYFFTPTPLPVADDTDDALLDNKQHQRSSLFSSEHNTEASPRPPRCDAGSPIMRDVSSSSHKKKRKKHHHHRRTSRGRDPDGEVLDRKMPAVIGASSNPAIEEYTHDWKMPAVLEASPNLAAPQTYDPNLAVQQKKYDAMRISGDASGLQQQHPGFVFSEMFQVDANAVDHRRHHLPVDQLSDVDDDSEQDIGGGPELLSVPEDTATSRRYLQPRVVPRSLSATSRNWQSVAPSLAMSGQGPPAGETQVRDNRFDQEIENKQTMLDDFASFAEASLGPYSLEDGTFSDVVSQQEPSLTSAPTPPALSHELLVIYLLSMGTTRQVAENLAFGFISQQSRAHIRSQSVRAMDMLEEPSISSTLSSGRRRIPRSVTLSKLDYLQQQQHQEYHRPMNTNSTPSSSVAYAAISSGSNSAGRESSTAVMFGAAAAVTSSSDGRHTSAGHSRRPRSYIRADRPGAVEMEGRAFGAPRRAAATSPTREIASDNAIEEGETPNEFAMIEASMVKDMPVVVGSKLSFKDVLREGPMRRFAILAIVLLLGAIAVICSLLLIRPGSASPAATVDDSSLAPSSAPTLIRVDILLAATEISGLDAVTQPDSPQFAAISWLSTFDEVLLDGTLGDSFLQRYIMVVLYFSTRGQDYLEPESWLNPRLHECGWSSGIFCRTDLTNRLIVFGIDLIRNGASGFLPQELGYLTTAEFIRMPKNRIGGTLPMSIWNLENLQVLDLGSNTINGHLPVQLANATKLNTLILSGNDLSGVLPTSLWDLTLLRTLDISSNKLSGSIPSEVSKLKVLVTLDVRRNLLSGTFPTALVSGALQKLDFILFDYNRLTGVIPDFDSSLIRRQEISLAHNFMVGPVPRINPAGLTFDIKAVRLQKIDISYNFLTGELNSVVSILPTLQHVDYSGNLFTGPFPDRPGWPSLEFMAFADNLFTGVIPILFPDSLVHFDVSGNDLTGTVPTALCNFPALQFLSLSGNDLDGTIPPCVVNLDRLRAFEISDTNVTGGIPSRMDQLRFLSILDFSNNTLTGTLPTAVGKLSKMVRLILNDNFLEGSIPSQLGSLSLTQRLYLDNNLLTGTVPPSFANLGYLRNISLSGNQLEGNIPDGMCSFNSLNLTSENVGCNVACSCCPDTGFCA